MLNSFYLGCIWELLKNRDFIVWRKTIILITNVYVVLLMKALCSLIDLNGGCILIRHSSLSLDMKYIKYRVINCIMVVLIKCINISIYFHKVHLQCLKAVMEYAIEPMEICLHKSSYTTHFWGLRSVLELHVTCLMFGICNFYSHKMFNCLLY